MRKLQSLKYQHGCFHILAIITVAIVAHRIITIDFATCEIFAIAFAYCGNIVVAYATLMIILIAYKTCNTVLITFTTHRIVAIPLLQLARLLQLLLHIVVPCAIAFAYCMSGASQLS